MKKIFLYLFILSFLVLVPIQQLSAQNPSITSQVSVVTYEELVVAIRQTRAESRQRIEQAVEQEKVREAWETGKLIDKHILQHEKRADYGKQVIERLAVDLETSAVELRFMLQFARAYPIRWPASKLSWSHYQSLLTINDPKERDELAKEAEEKNWGRDQVREEVRRRKLQTETPAELPEIIPGPLNTYPIVRLNNGLKIDLGFGAYYDLPQQAAKKFKEGDIIQKTGERIEKSDRTNQDLYTYSALVTQVVDGDTFHALIDLGFGVTLTQRVRLRRIDAPDLLTAQGREAKDYLEQILAPDKGRILLQSREIDQHGRPIADVWVKGKPIDQEMLDQGLAVRISE
jgi:endonuclease YncB( thermonuclease family)